MDADTPSSVETPSLSGRKKLVHAIVTATLLEGGIPSADSSVIDILMQLFELFTSELCLQAKDFCEHAGRTLPVPADLIMAYIEFGRDIYEVPAYASRAQRVIIPPPGVLSRPTQPKILQTCDQKPLHAYIPDYFPPFPDSHSYVMTPTFRKPISDYETIREKTSIHRCDIAGALSRFVARSPGAAFNFSLFPDPQDESRQNTSYQLIGIKRHNVPYLKALFPHNQEWDQETDEKAVIASVQSGGGGAATSSATNNTDSQAQQQSNNKDDKEQSSQPAQQASQSSDPNQPQSGDVAVEVVDNPHLRKPTVFLTEMIF